MTALKIIILMTVVSHHWALCVSDIRSNPKPGYVEGAPFPCWKFIMMLWMTVSIPALYTFELVEATVA
jgi:hypothetical protein